MQVIVKLSDGLVVIADATCLIIHGYKQELKLANNHILHGVAEVLSYESSY